MNEPPLGHGAHRLQQRASPNVSRSAPVSLGEMPAARSLQRKESARLVAQLQARLEHDSTGDERSSALETEGDDSEDSDSMEVLGETEQASLAEAWDRVRTRISSVSSRSRAEGSRGGFGDNTSDDAARNQEPTWTASDTSSTEGDSEDEEDDDSDYEGADREVHEFGADFDTDSTSETMDSEEISGFTSVADERTPQAAHGVVMLGTEHPDRRSLVRRSSGTSTQSTSPLRREEASPVQESLAHSARGSNAFPQQQFEVDGLNQEVAVTVTTPTGQLLGRQGKAKVTRRASNGSVNADGPLDLDELTPVQLKRVAKQHNVPLEMFPRRVDLQMHMQAMLEAGELGRFTPVRRKVVGSMETPVSGNLSAKERPASTSKPVLTMSDPVRDQIARMKQQKLLRKQKQQQHEEEQAQKQRDAAAAAAAAASSQRLASNRQLEKVRQQESTLSFAASPSKVAGRPRNYVYYRDVMQAVYAAFAPHKLKNVALLLQEWAGDEEDMLSIVRQRYSVTDFQIEQLLRQYRSLQRNDDQEQQFRSSDSNLARQSHVKTADVKESPVPKQLSQTGFICPNCRVSFMQIGDLLDHAPRCPQQQQQVFKGGHRASQLRARTAPNTPIQRGLHPLVSPPLAVAEKQRQRELEKQHQQRIKAQRKQEQRDQKLLQRALLKQKRQLEKERQLRDKLPRLKKDQLYVEEMPFRATRFPDIADWSSDFKAKRKPSEAAVKEVMRGRRALPETGAFVSYLEQQDTNKASKQKLGRKNSHDTFAPDDDMRLVTVYIGLKGCSMVDTIIDEQAKMLTKQQNDRDLEKIKWTLKTLKERMEAFKALQNNEIVEMSLRQLVSGQVCQVALNIRSFCEDIRAKYGRGGGNSTESGADSPGARVGARDLQEAQAFVAAQAKSLFKLEKSLCLQTEPKCPSELIRTQFFLKVEVEVMKRVRHALRPALRDPRADKIDSAFDAVRRLIAGPSAGTNGLSSEDSELVPLSKAFLLGIKDDLVGEPDSFGPAVDKLTSLAECYGQPSRQLVLLMELVETINAIAAKNVQAAYAHRGKKSKAASLMADDFLPLLMLVLLSADSNRVDRPYSSVVNSIQLLGQPRFLRGAAMYYVTSFDSAMSYLASDEFSTNVRNAVSSRNAELGSRAHPTE